MNAKKVPTMEDENHGYVFDKICNTWLENMDKKRKKVIKGFRLFYHS